MIDLPGWIDREAWDAFTEMRKAKGKRAPFTVAAAKRVLYELDRLRPNHNPTEVLWQSVINGWSGVFPLKPREAAPPAHEPFHAEERQTVDPARKAEIAEMLRRTRNNLTTRH